MITLRDYQQEALKTSDETNTLEYCVLGLVNEAGEVAGVVKKWLRGDYDETVMREKMLGELGDVLWYVAVTADRAGVDLSKFDHFEEIVWSTEWIDGISKYKALYDFDSKVKWKKFFAESCEMAEKCGTIGRVMFDDMFVSEVYPPDTKDLYEVTHMVRFLGSCLGFTLRDIAAHNIAKLRDRQARGVIRGSGDER